MASFALVVLCLCQVQHEPASFDKTAVLSHVIPEQSASAHVAKCSSPLQVILDTIAYGSDIKKTPVVVGNCTGFAVNRVFFPYTQAACMLVDLGLDPYMVDMVILKGFGMPMGPFRFACCCHFLHACMPCDPAVCPSRKQEKCTTQYLTAHTEKRRKEGGRGWMWGFK